MGKNCMVRSARRYGTTVQEPAPSLLSALPKTIEVEQVEREVRRIRYKLTAAKFPHHKDFGTFDYAASVIDKMTIVTLCTVQFHEMP